MKALLFSANACSQFVERFWVPEQDKSLFVHCRNKPGQDLSTSERIGFCLVQRSQAVEHPALLQIAARSVFQAILACEITTTGARRLSRAGIVELDAHGGSWRGRQSSKVADMATSGEAVAIGRNRTLYSASTNDALRAFMVNDPKSPRRLAHIALQRSRHDRAESQVFRGRIAPKSLHVTKDRLPNFIPSFHSDALPLTAGCVVART